jgi:phage baseplate assembly protein W
MPALESSVVLYSDISKNPSQSSSALVFNLAAIQQSLDNLFKTSVGTRAWQPEYGHYMDHILGEPMCTETADALILKAIEAVRRWEPRISVDFVNSKAVPEYENLQYSVQLVFTVNGLSSEDKFSYNTKISLAGGIS